MKKTRLFSILFFITLLSLNTVYSFKFLDASAFYKIEKNNPYKYHYDTLNVRITSGTEYAVSDLMDLEVMLTDDYGKPVEGANCVFRLYYPDKTLFKEMQTTYLDYGIYYNNSYNAPNILGTYTYSVDCFYGSTHAYTNKCLQVREITPFSGALPAECNIFLNGSASDYNNYKEYVTTIKNELGTNTVTSILKIC